MNTQHPSHTRRQFLVEVGRGMLTATVGIGLAHELGLASATAAEAEPRLEFGTHEPLVRLMQDTPAAKLLPILVEKLRGGTDLRALIAAGALANARTFGGEDYIGFHTMMALAPGYHMALEMPKERAPLPVLKVLYRNTARIQDTGGSDHETLHPVTPGAAPDAPAPFLRDAIRSRDKARADQAFAAIATTPEDALDALLQEVQDDTEVHRVVLPYRAWDLLSLIGRDHATTLLRQSVRYCVKSESWTRNRTRDLLAKLLDQHHLLDATPGTRRAEDPWIEDLSLTLFKSTPEQAASAAAAALAEGIAPDDIGAAISLAANQLILRDHGRPPNSETHGKPIGSVHGDSIGVHACDSANAWRNLARVSRPRNTFACLILGAYQVALDRVNRGGDFLNWEPLPLKQHIAAVKGEDPAGLLRELDEAIRANLQARASGIVHRSGQLGHEPAPIFDLLRTYAISEDGALHAEKFYRTCTEEFRAARPVFRWRQLSALARVTASEYGRPAPGIAEAKELLLKA